MDALIDVAAREDRVQLKLFANAITHVSCYYKFSEGNVLLAGRTIAHLLAVAGNLLATFVEHEARRALEYLAGGELQFQFAATVMLTQLARNAPNFMSHLKGGSQELVNEIVKAYSSKKMHIRLHAIELLNECLPLMRHDADDPNTKTAHAQIYINCRCVFIVRRGRLRKHPESSNYGGRCTHSWSLLFLQRRSSQLTQFRGFTPRQPACYETIAAPPHHSEWI